MLGFKKVFLWHLDRPSKWEQVMEKYELVSKTIKGAHQRYLNKRNKSAPKRRFGNTQN